MVKIFNPSDIDAFLYRKWKKPLEKWTRFAPTSIDKYVESQLKSNPSVDEKEVKGESYPEEDYEIDAYPR